MQKHSKLLDLMQIPCQTVLRRPSARCHIDACIFRADHTSRLCRAVSNYYLGIPRKMGIRGKTTAAAQFPFLQLLSFFMVLN